MADHAPHTSETAIAAVQQANCCLSSSPTAPAPPPSIPPSSSRLAPNGSSSSLRTVYIKNLSPTVDSVFLKITCSPYGDVSNVKIIREADGISKGFAFVTFKQAEQAKKAISMLNGKKLDGRILFAGPAIKRAARQHQQQQQQQQSNHQNTKGLQQSQNHQHAQNVYKTSTPPNSTSLKLGNFTDATSPQRKRHAISESMAGDEGCGTAPKPFTRTTLTGTSIEQRILNQQNRALSPTRSVLGDKNHDFSDRGLFKKLPRSLSSLVFSNGQGTAISNFRSRQNLRHVDSSPCSAAHRRRVKLCNECAAPTIPVATTSEDIQGIDGNACPSIFPQCNAFLPRAVSSQPPPSDSFHLPQISQRQLQLYQHQHQPQLQSQQMRKGKLQDYIDNYRAMSDGARQNPRKPCCAPLSHLNINVSQTHPRFLPQISAESTNCLSQRNFSQEGGLQQNNQKRRRAHSLQPCQDKHARKEEDCLEQKKLRVTSNEKGTLQDFQQHQPNSLVCGLQNQTYPELFGKRISDDQSSQHGCVSGFQKAGWGKEQAKRCPEFPNPKSQGEFSETVQPLVLPYPEEYYDPVLQSDRVAFNVEYQQTMEDQHAPFEQHLQQLYDPFHPHPWAQSSHLWQEQQQKDTESLWQEQMMYSQAEIKENIFTTSASLPESSNVLYPQQILNSADENVLLTSNPSQSTECYSYPNHLQLFDSLDPSDHMISQALQQGRSLDPISNSMSHPCQVDQICSPDLGEKSESPLPPDISGAIAFEVVQTHQFPQPTSSVVKGNSQSEQHTKPLISKANETRQSLSQAESLDTTAEEEGDTLGAHHCDCSSRDANKGDQSCPVCREQFQGATQTGSVLQQGINLYVKHLGEDVDDAELKELFSKFGEVLSAKVMMEGERSRGFGFVCFSRAEDAARATRDMRKNVDDVNKNHLYVAPAQRKEERQAFFREKLKAKRREVGKKLVNTKDCAKTENNVLASSAQGVSVFGKSLDGLNHIFPQSTLNVFNLSESTDESNCDGKSANQIPGSRNAQMLFFRRRKSNLSQFDCFNVERLRTPLIKPSRLNQGSIRDFVASGKIKKRSGDFLCRDSSNFLEFKGLNCIPQRQMDNGLEHGFSALGEQESLFLQWGSPHDESEESPKFPLNSNSPDIFEQSGDKAQQKITPIGYHLTNLSCTTDPELKTVCDTDPLFSDGRKETELSVGAQAFVSKDSLQSISASSCIVLPHEGSLSVNPSLTLPLLTAREVCDILDAPLVADSEYNNDSTSQDEKSIISAQTSPIVKAVWDIFDSESSDEQAGPFPVSDLCEAAASTETACKPVDGKLILNTQLVSGSAVEAQALEPISEDAFSCKVSKDLSNIKVQRRNLKRQRGSMEKEQSMFIESIQRYLDSLTDGSEDDCPRQPKRQMLEESVLLDSEGPKHAEFSTNTSGLALDEMLSWPVESQKASLSWVVCTSIRGLLGSAMSKGLGEMESSTLNLLLKRGWTLDALVNSLVAMAMELDVVEILNLLQSEDCLEIMILGVLAITLYVLSYVTLCHFKKKADHEEMYAGEEDAVVYRIALWLCTVTLTVSVGAVLLLPISIISNEVLLLYPTSYWIKWLNSSLIQGLWNLVFFFSNLSLFILMPFAYFFTEAEGFSGSRKILMARVKEATLVLILLGLIVMGLFYIASTIISGDEKSKQTLQEAILELDINKVLDMWYEHLPYLYSCISFFAVLALLMCTPVGVARMFTVMGRLIVKPQFLQDIEEELNTVRFEEENLMRKIKHRNGPANLNNGHITSVEELKETLKDIQKDRRALESRQHVSFWRRNLCYPVVMLLLLAITVFSILIVVQNIIRLLLGTQSLPSSVSENALGIASLSYFGSVGAALQIAVILYLMVASVVGFYSLPYMKLLQPRPQETSMVKIIVNCVVLLLLSSALPILSKTLGITNFDLLGKFGSMDWLRKFYIIFLYNAVFVVSTALCLVQKFTSPVWRGIYARLSVAFSRDRRGSGSSSHSPAGEGAGLAAGVNGGITNGSVGTKEDGFKEE